MATTYRVRSFDETSHGIAGQYSQCEDDDAAEQRADTLAAKSRRPNIVIWDDDRQTLREHSDPLSLSELIRRAEVAIARSRELRDETLFVLAKSRAIRGRSVALVSSLLANRNRRREGRLSETREALQ